MREQLEKLKETLIKKHFDAVVCADSRAAISCAAGILAGFAGLSSVAAGNSETLRQLGLFDVFTQYSPKVFAHKPGGATIEEDREALTSDIYFCSANALSMDGHIVNIDGTGNRTAATCFGPKKLVYIIGRNKVVPTLDDALIRARNTAAAGVAKKYGRKTPCTATGECSDCNAPECVCAVTTIHRRKPHGIDITVLLVDEDLGI